MKEDARSLDYGSYETHFPEFSSSEGPYGRANVVDMSKLLCTWSVAEETIYGPCCICAWFC